jgi:hypothetical protein
MMDTHIMATVHFPPPDVRVTYSGLAFAGRELALSFQAESIITHIGQLATIGGPRESAIESRALTESVESLDEVPSLPKCALVEAVAGKAVHLLLFPRTRYLRHKTSILELRLIQIGIYRGREEDDVGPG